MARLSKLELLRVFENAVRKAEWSILHLSAEGEHPARYRLYREVESYTICVYTWNVTHGGGPARPSHEYRIQITGIEEFSGSQQFQPEIGGKTLILGWMDEMGVFAGFDYSKHVGPLGASPSMQIGEEALHKATMFGFAPHYRGQGEIAIAFRPDFIATYVANLEHLHACGESTGEVEILDDIAGNHVEDAQIAEAVAEERQYSVVTTKRALRDINFRHRVLSVYSQRCAMCGLQLNLLEAAHILPAAEPGSADETTNGVALCCLHHRAYDAGLVTFAPDYRVHLNTAMIEDFRGLGVDGNLDQFLQQMRQFIALPPDKRDYPAPAFVDRANTLRGWNL